MRKQSEIKGSWDKSEPIIVSICCITYNHAKYIHDAVLGFLNQITNFPIEILIHDDASTDGTEEIIREYEAKYPKIIKPLYETENQYVKGRKGSRTFNIPRAQGKYIALCEGDDYWTNPFKLQKQVDFLESNPKYGLVHSDFDEYFQKDGKLLSSRQRRTKRLNNKNIKDIYFAQLNHDSYHVRTVTVCARRDLVLKAIKNIYGFLGEKMVFGDYPLFLELSRLTKFKYFDESMAVHRILPESASKTAKYKKRIKFLRAVYNIQKKFLEIYPCPPEIENEIHEQAGLIFLELAARNMDRELASEAKRILNKTSLKINLLDLASFIKPVNLVYFNFYSSIFGKGSRFIKRKLGLKKT